MPLKARMDVVEKFLGSGGLLLITDSAVEGLRLPSSQVAIHYDEPTDELGWDARGSRAVIQNAYVLSGRNHAILALPAPTTP
jgi:hypothetical protein